MKERQTDDSAVENGNGKGVRKDGEFLTKCMHPRGGMTLESFLRLFSEAQRRQEERRLLEKFNQAHSFHKKTPLTNFQANVYSIFLRCDFT